MRTLRSLITVASLVTLVLAISFTNGIRTAAQTSSQFPPGLVAWWPADGNALDVMGSNNGTLLNGTTFAAGKVGQAFNLDGIDDIVDLGPNNIIGSGNAPFTVAMWIYPTRIPTGWYYFTIRLKQDAQFFIAFTQDFFGAPGGLVGGVFRAEAHQWFTPIDHASLVNQWTHVAVIYNGGNKADASSFAIFFNGVQLPIGSIDLGPVGGDCNDNALGGDAGLSCLGDNGPGNTRFQGLIDEVQIYNRALSPAEVQSIVNLGTVIYTFSGFFQPVDNPPVLNVIKAGRGIAVKFSLSGNQGLNIFATGYPKSQQITCDTAVSIDDIEETDTVGSSGLTYDPLADQYIYHWKTNATWTGTCRQLIVRLNDGTDHVANFKFK